MWTPEQIDQLLASADASAIYAENIDLKLLNMHEAVDATNVNMYRLRSSFETDIAQVYTLLVVSAFCQLFMIGWRLYDLSTSHRRTAGDVGVGRV